MTEAVHRTIESAHRCALLNKSVKFTMQYRRLHMPGESNSNAHHLSPRRRSVVASPSLGKKIAHPQYLSPELRKWG